MLEEPDPGGSSGATLSPSAGVLDAAGSLPPPVPLSPLSVNLFFSVRFASSLDFSGAGRVWGRRHGKNPFTVLKQYFLTGILFK